jgi:glucose/arabinose dehydrogenase
MRLRPIALVALCAGLLCTACTGDAGPARSGSGPVPTGTSRPAAHVGQPSVLARNLAVPWAIAFLPGGDALVTERDSAIGSLGGKILRMTPDGRPAPGNPFGTLVWSYGHRNVQGLAWDGDGRMYATELGQNRVDEINRIQKGRNYGWPVVEGAGGGGTYADPELTWPTDQASPSGAAIAAGSIWVAALRGQRLRQVPLDDTGALGTPAAHFTGEYGRLREAVRAPDGSLWFTTSNRDGRGSPGPDDDMILVIRPR